MNDREQNAVAWLLYDTYELALWPLLTIYFGMIGISIAYGFAAGLPVFAMNLAQELRWQDEHEVPRRKLKTYLIQAFIFVLIALPLYYLGFMLNYAFG